MMLVEGKKDGRCVLVGLSSTLMSRLGGSSVLSTEF